MIYNWTCPYCFDFGVSNLPPRKCPSCSNSNISYEERPTSDEDIKDLYKMEFEKDEQKKRSK
jgi:hypothetical protein